MIVITDVSKEPPIKGDLFAGLQFWISQRCPNRIDLVKRVKYNGGEVVLNEKLAQYLIADHERGSLPSGSISYRFILDSVDNQQLEDVENHRCGPPVGSARTTASARPPRHGRVPFSAQDDIDLYRYVTSCKRKKCHINGNEIYKEFAKQNPRHSFQSWRDRYVKHLSVKPPLGASRLTPSPEPGPSESHTNTNDQKTLSETSTKPSNKSPAGASRPNPLLEPRALESPANTNGEKAAIGTLAESSDKPVVEASRPSPSLEPRSRPSESPTNTSGKKAATRASAELSYKPPVGASRTTPASEPRTSASPAKTTPQNDTTFTSKRSSNSAPQLKRISFGGSPSAIDKLCPDLPAVVDQFHLGDFDGLTGAGQMIEECVADNNQAWIGLAREHGDHTAEQWRTFWEDCVRPIYRQVGESQTKAQIYDQAQKEWEAKMGADASVREWVSYFRKELAPRLRELPTTPNKEQTNGHTGERQVEDLKVNGDAPNSDPGKSARIPSPRRKHENGSWNTDGHYSSPVQSSLGKRQRGNDSDAENQNETPPAKRPQLDIPEEESEDKIHDSIEFSPSKKLASSSLGERKVIQIGFERSSSSSSSSSDLFVRGPSKDKGPEVQGSPKVEPEQDETQENEEGDIFEGWQGHIRRTLWELDDQKILELLELLRTAPSAPEEPDDMLPFDAAVMRTVHVLSTTDQSAAQWQAFKGVLLEKLQELGILAQLLEHDESDDESDEGEEEDQEEELNGLNGYQEEQNENQEEHFEHQDDQYEHQEQNEPLGDQYEHEEQYAPHDQQYEPQDEQYGQHDEQSALENGATNGQFDYEPTTVPESPLREVTPQINDSNDSTFTFVDSITQIDDENPSDYPIDLTSEAEAQAYITSRLSPPWAFSEAEILIALHATCSNSAALADRVLRWMRQNDPIKGKGKGKERSRGRRSSIGPNDKFLPVMAGVWTGDDDEAIVGMAGPEEEERIVRKHGATRCKQRRAFLMSFE